MRSISLSIAALVTTLVVSATTLEKLSMADMSAQSHVVVRATVVSGAAEYSSGSIFTHYILNISEVWKGTAGSRIDIYVPGGRAAGLRELVPGAPVLNNGTEYLLYLWIGPSGRPQIIGLSQGLFNVVKDSTGTMLLERPGAKETVLDPVSGRPVTDQVVRMKVSDAKALAKKWQTVRQ